MQVGATTKFTRHEVLVGALRALAVVVLPALTGWPREAAAAKAHKEDVSYQDQPKAGRSCASCRQFSPTAPGNGTCSIVEGDVSASGWCTAYSPKGQASSQDSPRIAVIRAHRNRVRNTAAPSTASLDEGVHT